MAAPAAAANETKKAARDRKGAVATRRIMRGWAEAQSASHEGTSREKVRTVLVKLSGVLAEGEGTKKLDQLARPPQIKQR